MLFQKLILLTGVFRESTSSTDWSRNQNSIELPKKLYLSWTAKIEIKKKSVELVELFYFFNKYILISLDKNEDIQNSII